MAYNPEAMAQAQEAAFDELRELLKAMKPAERKGATALVNWVRRNFGAAGYKRLLSSKYGGILTWDEEFPQE